MNIKSITVEYENGQTQIWGKYLNAEITEERGYAMEGHNDVGKPTDIIPNGHQRLIIKAWRGCKDFDSFVLRGLGA